jgi:ATPase subunit of ABC transporter with duplicated ATPase domains
MTTTDKPKTETKMKARFGETDFHGDEVLLCRGVAKGFGERTLFSDVDLLVRGGERIGLIGDNGTGKSTFIKMVMNEEDPSLGLLRLGPSVKIAYLPQIVTFKDMNLTVLETMMYEGKCSMQEARDRLGAYLFRGEDVQTKVSQLSGGERSRLKLCMIMKTGVNLLILDEPTNHLDIASREWMEDALLDYNEALLFVSHDRYFINKFATRIWEIRDGKIFDYNCGFERYREIVERERMLQLNVPKEQKTVKEKAPEKVPQKEKKMSPSTREKLVKKLEREIANLENEIAENEKQQEENSSDYTKLMELTEKQAELMASLEEKYAQWEELAE